MRAAAQAKPEAQLFELKKIGEGVYAAISPGESKAGANAGFVIGDDSVAVIDTFEDASAAKVLLDEIRKITKLPVRFVVNTHYHLDHVAGNGVFAETGAVVVAHRNVREWIHTENLKFFGAKITPEQKKLVESLAAPSVVYSDSLDLYLGSRHLVLRFFPGHTGGDTVVEIPDAHAVFCGDLFWRKTLPNLIDASTEKWIETLDKFQSIAPERRVRSRPRRCRQRGRRQRFSRLSHRAAHRGGCGAVRGKSRRGRGGSRSARSASQIRNVGFLQIFRQGKYRRYREGIEGREARPDTRERLISEAKGRVPPRPLLSIPVLKLRAIFRRYHFTRTR